MIFSYDNCMNMVTTKTYVTETQSFPLRLNALNSITYYTHGSNTFSGSNIYCNGQSLRLSNGLMNSGMIRQEHLLIELRSRDLMIIDGKVVEPSTQTALGKPEIGYTISGATTFIWSYQPDKCQLMTILQTELETATGNEWFNQEVKIQITSLDTYHDTSCDLKITKTSADNIFLVDNSQSTSHLKHINAININLSIDLKIRFGYLYSEIRKILQDSYQVRNPLCTHIGRIGMSETQTIGPNKFLRNMGDASVSFTCKEVQVAPSTLDGCFFMAKVTDITGLTWYLNPNNRILMTKAVQVQCTPAELPVYRNINGQLLIFNPQRTLVKEEHPSKPNMTNDDQEAGIYPTEMVKQWLNYAFLQHLNKFSYTNLAEVICQGDCTQDTIADTPSFKQFINSNIMNPLPTKWFGHDIDLVERICSIACSLYLTIYCIYAAVAWIIRVAIFRKDNIGYLALFLRATFPEFYIITVNNTGSS